MNIVKAIIKKKLIKKLVNNLKIITNDIDILNNYKPINNICKHCNTQINNNIKLLNNNNVCPYCYTIIN